MIPSCPMSINLFSKYANLPPPKIEAEELRSKTIAESELQSEAIAESEPDWKRARLELKDIDDVEEWEVSSIWTFGPDSDSDPEWEDCHRSGFESEVESKEDSRRPPWELKGFDDLELSDFSMYDNDPLPIAFDTKNGLYKNQAMIDSEKAYDEYLEQAPNLETGPWDAIAPPQNLQLVGGIRPYAITDEERPRFIHYCNLSLNKYNAENQGANFVFYELVKATTAVSCGLYYITFMAKDASNNNSTDASTFQAEVSKKVVPYDVEPEIILCLRKPN